MFNFYCAHGQQNAKEQPILPVAPSKEERMWVLSRCKTGSR